MTAKIYLTPDSKPEFIGQIVDLFEDYLTDNQIELKSKERDEAIADGDCEPEEAAILYGDYYDKIGDTISEIIEEHKLMQNPFTDTAIMQRQVETIMDVFYEVLKDGEYLRIIPTTDVTLLINKISDIFRKWGLV